MEDCEDDDPQRFRCRCIRELVVEADKLIGNGIMGRTHFIYGTVQTRFPPALGSRLLPDRSVVASIVLTGRGVILHI